MNQNKTFQTPLSLSTISTISKSLESIVTELYGPHGFKILLSSATGHVMVTNDCGCILNSLHLSHPLAKFIVESLLNTLSVSCDNGKTFILYLSAMLDGIVGEFKLDSRHEQSQELKTNQLTKTKVAHLLHTFLQVVYPNITRTVQEKLITFYKKSSISVAMGTSHLKGTIKGVLSPHFTPKLTDFFTEILHEMLFSSVHLNDFLSILQLVADNFNIFHCKVVNQPYNSSRCINSLIIQRDFTVYCESLTRKPIRFVLCQFSMNIQSNDQNSREIISIRSTSKANKFIIHQLEKLRSFLDHCIEKEIGLILSAEKFPDYSLHLFRERNISLIHCVLEEDIEFIKLVMKRQALLDISENIDDCLNIVTASFCSPLDLGIRSFVHLNLGDHVPKSIIISAPTDGLCSNVALIIHKAIKYLLFALKSSTEVDSFFEREVTLVQREVNNIQREVTAVQREVNTIQREVTSVEREVNTIQREVTAVQREVNTIQREVTSVQREVNTIQREVTAVQREVNTIQREESVVQSEVNTIQGEITTVKSTTLYTEKNHCFQIGNENSLESDSLEYSKETDVHDRQRQHEVTLEHGHNLRDLAPGGGTLDFMIAKVLNEFSHKSSDVDIKTICKIVQNATLRIPKILHWNNSLCAPGEKSHEFHKLQMEAFKKLDEGEMLGIDRKGVLTNMLNHNVFESVHCKFYVIHSVIQTLIQILRMDFIVGVNKLNN